MLFNLDAILVKIAITLLLLLFLCSSYTLAALNTNSHHSSYPSSSNHPRTLLSPSPPPQPADPYAHHPKLYHLQQSTLADHQAAAAVGSSASTLCRTVPGLTRTQRDLCHRYPDTVTAALLGLRQSAQECQHQFAGDRWNCSTLAARNQNPYTSVVFQQGFKESAFATALSSASVAIAVARGCSQGLLVHCDCQDPRTYKRGGGSLTNIGAAAAAGGVMTAGIVDGGGGGSDVATTWKWGGCSHNLQYGMRFSKMFLDGKGAMASGNGRGRGNGVKSRMAKPATDIHSKISRHNNQLGRKLVKTHMERKCKCHGMSGSCAMKTCWKITPSLRSIGAILKERFKYAIQVDQTNLGNENPKMFKIVQNTARRYPKQRPITATSSHTTRNKRRRDLAHDLLYYERSPSYCDSDARLDIAGTAGRLCNRTSPAPDNCVVLCCGRGYNYVRRKRVENCRCEFLWCCRVRCDKCVIEEWVTVCK